MAENCSTWLLGDAQVELAGKYLGAGAVTIRLAPEFLNIRRDGMSKVAARRVTRLALTVTAVLPGPERLLDVLDGSDNNGFTLSDFAAAPFASGSVLKVYPNDPGLRGFSFPSVYLRESADASGKYLENGSLTAVFECEANTSGVYFTRLAANARPTGNAVRTMPDLTALSQALIAALATPLEATVNTALSRETPLPGNGTHYTLLLKSCGGFHDHAPREIRYELVARGSSAEHDAAVNRLAAAANTLHGLRPVITGFAPLAVKVESLECNKAMTIQGKSARESRLIFTLQLA